MNITNQKLQEFIDKARSLYQPEDVVYFDGSKQMADQINHLLVDKGIFTPLDEKAYPNSFWSRSEQSDVARVEGRTFICSKSESDAGPTNNWADPKELRAKLDAMMAGCMKGRTMYVVPYLMGPVGSPYSKFGVELTDSPYVIANMQIMATCGTAAIDHLTADSKNFVCGVHSYGTIDPEHRYIAHFPEDLEVISYNTNYGGNVLQGKKCFALRLASVMGRQQGWLAEHMLILAITRPTGEKFYIAAAFPSACGKTNLAMMVPPDDYLKAGWKVETVGDDIAWLNIGEDGQLYAINPEQGFFGVAPGTSVKNNPNALKTLAKGNTIFTNTAIDIVNRLPWWQELGEKPEKIINWKGEEKSREEIEKTDAHPNSRFTTPASQCPSIAPEWQSPEGVPLAAIIFGGRRAKSAPLIYEAENWEHGVYLGASMSSETTAAASGAVGEIRRDPMAMRPFIGYHVGDYFQHWLDMGKKVSKQPKFFHVNWFRTDDNGNFLWPGFGENIRVLEWVTNRITGDCGARESELGLLPKLEDINFDNLELTASQQEELFKIQYKNWESDLVSQQDFFDSCGSKLPAAIRDKFESLRNKLKAKDNQISEQCAVA